MKTALIIPAYKPDMKLIELLHEFDNDSEFVPVVVDDGSGSDFSSVFEALPQGVRLLRHEVNRGKGAALKTAMCFVLKDMPECLCAITADADGQHKHDDILRVAAQAWEAPEQLTMGSRRFDGVVPFRSRFGNSLTRQVFHISTGAKVYDTQTGLRAFGRDVMEKFSHISGERYEYEINMLLWAAKNGIKINEVWIKTVYIDDNSSSHFHPLRDGLKIYGCILKFSASSFIGFIVDYLLVLILNPIFVNGSMFANEAAALLATLVLARVVSATVNFCINRTMVFHGNESVAASAVKYAILAVFVLVVKYYLVHFQNIGLGWSLALSNLLAEVLLFSLSFVLQGKFVYRKLSRR